MNLRSYLVSLVDPKFMPTAFKVAVVVGSLLFIVNHGTALVQGQMTRDRWIAATITYLIPYCVNIHGQYISSSRKL